MADTPQVTFKGNPVTLAGTPPKAGEPAPDFETVNGKLELIDLEKTAGKPRLFSVVPSLDTGVCSTMTKTFNQRLAALGDQVACYTVSLDMPFAQNRFCTAENITSMQTLSDVHDHSFGKNWGVLVAGLPVPLLARSVFVVDPQNTVRYAEVVSEIASEPNYDAALRALEQVAGQK